MAKKLHIAVPFKKTARALLAYLTRSKNTAIAQGAGEAVLETLELREDLYVTRLAEKLDREGIKTYSHKEIWG